MSTAVATTYTKTKCLGVTLAWNEETGERVRQAFISMWGRDCVCIEGGPCWLAAGVIKRMEERFERTKAESAHRPEVDVPGYCTCGALTRLCVGSEVDWVLQEALALAREGVGQDDRRGKFVARKRAVLDRIEAQSSIS